MPKKQTPTTKTGYLWEYLSHNFPIAPDNVNALLNGHVMFLFINCGRNFSATRDTLLQQFGLDVLLNSITRISRRLAKVKNYSRDADQQLAHAICNEVFVAPPTPRNAPEVPPPPKIAPAPPTVLAPIAPSTSGPSSSGFVAPLSHPSPQLTTSSDLRRSHRLFQQETPTKLGLRRKLDLLSHRNRCEQQRSRKQLRELRARQGNRVSLGRYNEAIKRKNKTIARLRHEICELQNGTKIKIFKRKINSLQVKSRRQREKAILEVSSLESTIASVEDKLKQRDLEIYELQNSLLELEDQVLELIATASTIIAPDVRLRVYDCVTSNVPIRQIPTLLEKTYARFGVTSSPPTYSSCLLMARELGVIANLHAGEVLLSQENLTLGFDATTQDGVHVNAILITTKHNTQQEACHVIAIDQLPGGTAEDYSNHIISTFDHLADVTSSLLCLNYAECRKKMIKNVSNTMTDRAAVNHASIRLVGEAWSKNFNELNCHLHPLELIASSARSSLRCCERELDVATGSCFGKNECLAANLILAINKFRYKDGKGDPKSFKIFLSNRGLPLGLLPRYRGNRLHIIFHISGKLFEHQEAFANFFKDGIASCAALKTAIAKDFGSPVVNVELQVLGLVGKLLSGPWMTAFYTSSKSQQCSHVDAIGTIKDVVIPNIRRASEHPLLTLTQTHDFFNTELNATDNTIHALQQTPADRHQFAAFMKACLISSITVLERQYEKYFNMDITDKLLEETQSARTHNIDAEEVMGMFSAAKIRAPAATMCFISSRIRSAKNKVMDYLNGMDAEKRDNTIRKSISLARKLTSANRAAQVDLRKELLRRQNLKKEMKEKSVKRKLKLELRSPQLNISSRFPDWKEGRRNLLKDVLTGKVIGRMLLHLWYNRDAGAEEWWQGRIEKLKKSEGGKYVIKHWKDDIPRDLAIEWDVNLYDLAVDFVHDEVVFG